jgi:hypothetical protein
MVYLIKHQGWTVWKPIIDTMWQRAAHDTSFPTLYSVLQKLLEQNVALPESTTHILSLMLPAADEALKSGQTNASANPSILECCLNVLQTALDWNFHVPHIITTLRAACSEEKESPLFHAFFTRYIPQIIENPLLISVDAATTFYELYGIVEYRLSMLISFSQPTTSWAFPIPQPAYRCYYQQSLDPASLAFLRSQQQEYKTPNERFHNITAAQKYATYVTEQVRGVQALAFGSGRTAAVKITKVDRPHDKGRIQENHSKIKSITDLRNKLKATVQSMSMSVNFENNFITNSSSTAALGTSSSNLTAATLEQHQTTVPVAKRAKYEVIDLT